MQNTLREDSNKIIRETLAAVLPDTAVKNALQKHEFGSGRIRLIAVGKAAWQMAKTADTILGSRIEAGLVLTKYGHGKGPIANYQILEAGHPVPDENTILGTKAALALTSGLTAQDTVLFLLSGGGSALFESPLISLDELKSLTQALLACGADIGEINTIRKRVSEVKGGRFALHCAPAKVFSIILSDVLGDQVDQIASGPTVLDTSTREDAMKILEKYHLDAGAVIDCVTVADTPRELDNVETIATGSVRQLCAAAADASSALGYKPCLLTDRLTCEAREAGAFLSAIAQSHQDTEMPLAYIAGGETVVHLTGTGLGGRNQELALSASAGLDGLTNCAVFSIDSDGTDGPTDAAGGYVDGGTAEALRRAGVDLYQTLQDNDAYHALQKVNGLIQTGSTGTNVNDVAVLLIQNKRERRGRSMAQTYIERMSINLRPAVCNAGKRWEEMAPMRDGVKLRTLFYMPDTEGPWPVLFSRTPYPKNQEIYDYQGKIFSERGYGFICQYSRGMGGSEGEWAPFENEKADGADALKWLQQQDYIGSIGLYGFSYVGYTQLVVLDQLPPKVKTAYMVHFGTDRYRQMYCNGLFRHDIYTPWAKDNNGLGRVLPYEAALEACRYKPHVDADRAVWNMELPWYKQWITHPDYADPFWKDSFWEDLKAIPGKVDIPIYLGCGWYDHHFGGMMEAYRSLSEYGKAHSRLVIGPWVHMKEGGIEGHDTQDAFAAGIHGYEGALAWMDRCLRDGEIPNQEVVVYGIGQGWRELAQWPGASTPQRFHFTKKGLLPEVPSETDSLCYAYDPSNVIETHGSECMCYAPLTARGSVLQPEPGTREDVISLLSALLTVPIILNGTVKVCLNVSTDAEDTAFVVRLMEVTPEGKSYNIRTSATTLRYRNGAEYAQPYTPGQQVECELEMWDILWQLPAGSRIRVDIASSSFPEYNIHLNTAEPWAEQQTPIIAHQQIWIGGDSGSYIELPIESA